jgi:hypothetical protein
MKKRTASPIGDEEYIDTPFGGLFGSISQQKVLQEFVADPYSTYTPTDLTELTDLTEPTVREAIGVLLRLGIIRNISRRTSRPLYQVNMESKRLTALTFLTYATLDDRYGEEHMLDAIQYCFETVQSSWTELVSGSDTSVMESSYASIARAAISDDVRAAARELV